MTPPVFVVDTNVLTARSDHHGRDDPGDTHLWALLNSHAGSILITGDRLPLEHPPDRASVISPRTDVDCVGGDQPAAPVRSPIPAPTAPA